MAEITLRAVDPKLKRLIKIEAARQGKSLKDFILSRISQDLENRKRNAAHAHRHKNKNQEKTADV